MTGPTILALVRHGESAWIAEGRFQGRGDPPLSETGRRQAAAVGARLAAPATAPALPVPDTAPLAIWHSPLLRAAQTAEAVHAARHGDTPLIALDDLAELSQGDWEGLTHDEVRQRWPAELAAWREDPLNHHAPGGESLRDASVRAERAGRTVLDQERRDSASDDSPGRGPAEPVLGYERTFGSGQEPGWAIIVAHDGILRLLMLGLLGVPIERFWSFPLALAAVSVLDTTSGVVRLRAHNLDEHIAALARR